MGAHTNCIFRITALAVGSIVSSALIADCSLAVTDRLESPWCEIQVIDAATGRGVPLVELETVNSVRFVTDNAGRVAFAEPGLVNQEVFFFVRSHGYELPKDGFGFAGVRITPRPGVPVEIKLTRRIVAERLCRLTGE